MDRVTLGRSGVEVTRLGLGTAPLGGWPEPVDEETAGATIEAAWRAGIRFFDTAPLYGHGFSERMLGRALRGRPRSGYCVSSKVGRLLTDGPSDQPVLFRDKPLNPVFDFSAEGVTRSFGESLERLGVDHLDVVHIHDPDDHHDEALAASLPALRTLRAAGSARAIGAGMNQVEMPARFAREADFDCFLIAGRYTLLEQPALDELLPLCLERGISIVAGGVFNSGVLAGPRAGAHYDYRPASTAVVERARRIAEVCERHRTPVRAAALQFPLGHSAVAAVLTGPRSPRELRENVEAFLRPVPAVLWEDLKTRGLLRADAPTPPERP